ncbi:Hypothetical protein CINCED_3A015520 [Cinara cedri]|uniref:Uncharacterized protein n=1 Tax=Cinara cedri TaxID=506608 RepID=A0A5E4MP87_9HEMI|nr:Hypothetical protein CINCED_3A015520 [Cinara cedri]
MRKSQIEEKNYKLDEIALQMGHEVLRIPLNHCQYNPIELIWAQVKGKVAEKNNTFKIVDVEVLVNSALDTVTTEDWAKCDDRASLFSSRNIVSALGIHCNLSCS